MGDTPPRPRPRHINRCTRTAVASTPQHRHPRSPSVSLAPGIRSFPPAVRLRFFSDSGATGAPPPPPTASLSPPHHREAGATIHFDGGPRDRLLRRQPNLAAAKSRRRRPKRQACPPQGSAPDSSSLPLSIATTHAARPGVERRRARRRLCATVGPTWLCHVTARSAPPRR